MDFFTPFSLPALAFNEPHCPIDHNLLGIKYLSIEFLGLYSNYYLQMSVDAHRFINACVVFFHSTSLFCNW